MVNVAPSRIALTDVVELLGDIAERLEASPLDEETSVGLLDDLAAAREQARALVHEVETRSRQIEAQRRFIAQVVDSLPLGLYVIDRDYRIHAWNRKREMGIQGVSREEAIGRTIFEILHRQPAEVLRREFDEVFATGRMQQFQMESRATGDARTYRITKIPMRLDDGPVTHVITIGEDVTEWKAALDRTSQAEKLAALGQMVAGVMHEINNPLATISAVAETMEATLTDLETAGGTAPLGFPEYLQIVDGEVHRCKRIIDGLLDFSRTKPREKTPADLNAIVDRTLFLLKHHQKFKHFALDVRLHPALGARVRANEEQIVQVLMALLLNAVDAVEGRGHVAIRTRRLDGTPAALCAEIIDDGHGIPREARSRLFEPFYTTKSPGSGTGLGLSIAYSIVADHGGRIEVESAPGKGSTFRVVLPLEETA